MSQKAARNDCHPALVWLERAGRDLVDVVGDLRLDVGGDLVGELAKGDAAVDEVGRDGGTLAS